MTNKTAVKAPTVDDSKTSEASKAPDTASEINKDAEENQTNMQKAADKAAAGEKSKEPEENAEAPNADAFNKLLEANELLAQQNTDLHKIVKMLQKGKAPPQPKAPRPAGSYKLTSPFWNGRVRVEAGTVKKFAEGDAPQSAKFLGE